MEETDKEFVDEMVIDIINKSIMSVYGIKSKADATDTIVVNFRVKLVKSRWPVKRGPESQKRGIQPRKGHRILPAADR